VATRDVEVGNAAIVDGVPLWGPLEGFLVLEDVFLESLDLLGEPPILHGSVGLSVDDGGEQPICDGVQELVVNVGVSSKHGLGGPWRHGRWPQSWRTRDRKGS